jgi:hypothetical protein
VRRRGRSAGAEAAPEGGAAERGHQERRTRKEEKKIKWPFSVYSLLLQYLFWRSLFQTIKSVYSAPYTRFKGSIFTGSARVALTLAALFYRRRTVSTPLSPRLKPA